MSRLRPALLVSAIPLLAHCGAGSEPLPAPPARSGPDCEALAAAARRATACDPELERVATQLLVEPDEVRCRQVARGLLAGPPTTRVQSVHTESSPGPQTPLHDEERARLASLPLPGRLRVTPDVPPTEGRPSTLVKIDGQELARDKAGVSATAVEPGQHQLELLHAGARTRACIQLNQCETVRLTAHGSELAPHQAISQGPC